MNVLCDQIVSSKNDQAKAFSTIYLFSRSRMKFLGAPLIPADTPNNIPGSFAPAATTQIHGLMLEEVPEGRPSCSRPAADLISTWHNFCALVALHKFNKWAKSQVPITARVRVGAQCGKSALWFPYQIIFWLCFIKSKLWRRFTEFRTRRVWPPIVSEPRETHCLRENLLIQTVCCSLIEGKWNPSIPAVRNQESWSGGSVIVD